MGTRPLSSAIAALLLLGTAGIAGAQGCPGNSDALGTSRTIVVDPLEHGRIGSMQYPETLPLAEREVVLTFDDGPLPPHTGRVLDILASECVQATFFLVGRQAQAFPDGVRRVYDAGHTVGTHSHSHPRAFAKVASERARREIDGGVAAVGAALGEGRVLAPFFRFPGFGRSPAMEEHATGRGLMIWGADVPADDWMRLSADEVVRRAIGRLEQKGRGVLLLHDIQRVTVTALPTILRELKRRGFRVVHVLPAQPDRPKTVTDPSAWAFRHGGGPVWPPVLVGKSNVTPVLPVPSRLSFGFPDPFAVTVTIPAAEAARPPAVVEQIGFRARAARLHKLVWPAVAGPTLAAAPVLPIPSAESLDFDYPRRLRSAEARAEYASAFPVGAKLASAGDDVGLIREVPEPPPVWSRLIGWFR